MENQNTETIATRKNAIRNQMSILLLKSSQRHLKLQSQSKTAIAENWIRRSMSQRRCRLGSL